MTTENQNAVTPEAARTFLNDYVPDPASLKSMQDGDVVKYYERVNATNQKVFKTLTEKQQAEAAKAREATKYEVALPENSPLSPADVERSVEFAKKHGLSNEQANELLGLRSDAVAQERARMDSKLKALRTEWQTALKADPKLGGDNLVVTQKRQMAVLDKYGTPELRQHMQTTGWIDHPDVVRFLNAIGAAMEPDKPVIPSGGPTKQQTAAAKLYGEASAT